MVDDGVRESVEPAATATGVPVVAVWTPVRVRLSTNQPTVLVPAAV